MDARRVLAMVVLCFALVGCSASPMPGPSSPAPMIPQPTSGVSLRRLGVTHEQAEYLWLPHGTTLTYVAEQPNLIIVTGPGDEGTDVGAYLAQTLPELGWDITVEADDALTFVRGEWQGAFAIGAGGAEWSLTVRND